MTTVDARNPVPILKCTCFCSVTTMIFSITLGYLVGGFNYFSIFTAIWGTFPFWLRGGNHQLVIKVDFRSINHQQWYVLSVKVPRFTWGFTRFEKKRLEVKASGGNRSAVCWGRIFALKLFRIIFQFWWFRILRHCLKDPRRNSSTFEQCLKLLLVVLYRGLYCPLLFTWVFQPI